MKKNIYKGLLKTAAVFALVVGVTESCTPESNIRDGISEITLKPTASNTLVNVGSTIKYTDSSLTVASRTWTFDGGNVTSSDQAVVDVTYDTAGEYSTELSVTHDDGSIESNNFLVKVYDPIIVDFSADKNAALFNSEITFTNASQNTESEYENENPELGDQVLWEFEGGSPATSTEQNPVVTYPTVGKFKVRLSVYRHAPEFAATLVKDGFIDIVDVAVIGAVSNRMSGFGSKISLTYDADLNPVEVDKLTLMVDGAEAVISSVEVDPADMKTMILNLETPIVDDQIVSLSYQGGDFAASGELLGPIVDLAIENTVVNLLKDSNPGFEADGPGGFPSVGWGNWANSFGNNPQDYAVIDSDSHSGNHSLQITLDGIKDAYILNTGGHVDLEEGTYRMSVWMKGSVDDIALDFRAVASGWAHASSGASTITSEWTEHTFEFSTVGNTVLNRQYWHVLRPLEEAAGTIVYMDDVSLYRID